VNQLKVKNSLRKIKAHAYQMIPVSSESSLVTNHFRFWSSLRHPNRRAFEIVISELAGKAAIIVETGTSAWGTDSTRLWARYVQKFGGEVWTVDLRKEASHRLVGQLTGQVNFVIGDSVDFLQQNEFPKANLYYLDSWDVDWENSLPAAEHGLKEFHAIEKNLRPGDIVMIDDTPRDFEFIPDEFSIFAEKFKEIHSVMPGKGAFILKEIIGDLKYDIIYHEYSIVLKIR
jgi:hypothetical protein